MNVMLKTLLGMSLVMSAGFTYAGNCSDPKDDFDDLNCLNEVYQKSDQELDEVYAMLRKLMNTSQKKQLIKDQKNWQSSLKHDCSIMREGYFFVSLGCTTVATIERTYELQDRLDACKAGQCSI